MHRYPLSRFPLRAFNFAGSPQGSVQALGHQVAPGRNILNHEVFLGRQRPPSIRQADLVTIPPTHTGDDKAVPVQFADRSGSSRSECCRPASRWGCARPRPDRAACPWANTPRPGSTAPAALGCHHLDGAGVGELGQLAVRPGDADVAKTDCLRQALIAGCWPVRKCQPSAVSGRP